MSTTFIPDVYTNSELGIYLWEWKFGNIFVHEYLQIIPGLQPRARWIQGKFSATEDFQTTRPSKATLIFTQISLSSHIYAHTRTYVKCSICRRICPLICWVSCFWLLEGHAMLTPLCVSFLISNYSSNAVVATLELLFSLYTLRTGRIEATIIKNSGTAVSTNCTAKVPTPNVLTCCFSSTVNINTTQYAMGNKLV